VPNWKINWVSWNPIWSYLKNNDNNLHLNTQFLHILFNTIGTHKYIIIKSNCYKLITSIYESKYYIRFQYFKCLINSFKWYDYIMNYLNTNTISHIKAWRLFLFFLLVIQVISNKCKLSKLNKNRYDDDYLKQIQIISFNVL